MILARVWFVLMEGGKDLAMFWDCPNANDIQFLIIFSGSQQAGTQNWPLSAQRSIILLSLHTTCFNWGSGALGVSCMLLSGCATSPRGKVMHRDVSVRPPGSRGSESQCNLLTDTDTGASAHQICCLCPYRSTWQVQRHHIWSSWPLALQCRPQSQTEAKWVWLVYCLATGEEQSKKSK